MTEDRELIEKARAWAFATVSPDQRVCEHHKTWDDQLQPTGEACGAPAEFLIIWRETRQVSFGCAEHAGNIDPRAPEYTLSRLLVEEV